MRERLQMRRGPSSVNARNLRWQQARAEVGKTGVGGPQIGNWLTTAEASVMVGIKRQSSSAGDEDPRRPTTTTRAAFLLCLQLSRLLLQDRSARIIWKNRRKKNRDADRPDSFAFGSLLLLVLLALLRRWWALPQVPDRPARQCEIEMRNQRSKHSDGRAGPGAVVCLEGCGFRSLQRAS